MPQFNNRVVLITGSASGIGQATAVEFARCGARLALTDVNEAGLQETVKLCKQQGLTDEQIFMIVGDLLNEKDITRLAKTVQGHFHGVDILVNNAGTIDETDGSAERATSVALENSFRLLFKAPVLLTQLLIPTLRERRGCIVNVSSVQGVVPQWYIMAYSSMKTALVAFTTASAQELAPEIRVNCVCPGAIDTPLQIKAEPDPVKRALGAEFINGYTPLKRFGQPEEVAKAIVYLASEEAAFITGHSLVVDGGLCGRGIQTHSDRDSCTK